MRKTILITIGVALIVFIAIFLYFVTGVSSTYAPIKQYEYSGTTDQLITVIRKYASTNSGITFEITDTTGNKKNGYATYMSIEAKNIEYSLKCEEQNSDSNLSKTIVSLVGAYDKSRNIGGYSTEAKGISGMIDKFDLNILKPLRNSQNIKITPL